MFNCLQILLSKFYTVAIAEKADPETNKWFYQSINDHFNYYLDAYDAMTAKKKYYTCYNPEEINYAYNTNFFLKNTKYFDQALKQKYINSLLNSLRFAASNNKKWEERYIVTYNYELKYLLNSLLYYYKNEKDEANISKVNNCLEVWKEEQANSGEMREALMAL